MPTRNWLNLRWVQMPAGLHWNWGRTIRLHSVPTNCYFLHPESLLHGNVHHDRNGQLSVSVSLRILRYTFKLLFGLDFTKFISGRNCENYSNVCKPNLCQNGGTCIVSSNGVYRCLCTAFFTGPTCQEEREGSFVKCYCLRKLIWNFSLWRKFEGYWGHSEISSECGKLQASGQLCLDHRNKFFLGVKHNVHEI